MSDDYSIRCSRIKEKELEFIEGYMWEDDKTTKKAFDAQKPNDLKQCALGNVALDLYRGHHDLVDTITISSEHFEKMRGV